MKEETKEIIAEKVDEAVETAEEVVRHPWTIRFAKFGFYAKGFLFFIIGLLAILVAIGDRNGKLTDTTGALAAIAQAPFGKFLLVVFIIGSSSHAIWNILRGIADVDQAGGKWQGIVKRIFYAGTGIFYFLLAWSAWHLLKMANVTDANGQITRTFTSFLFALPLGFILVFLIGLGIFIAGLHQGYFGLWRRFEEYYFLDKLEGANYLVFEVLSVLSFLARAVIFALIGYFFVWAAIDYNPNEAVGMDGALQTLSQSYFGKGLLFFTAAGLVSQGFLALYEAKYRRIY